ncbi:MAG: flagellar basal body rod protein FlgC [Pseudomonadota bacterium]
MFELKKAMRVAASGMSAQSFRLRLVGENIANVDTSGFQRKTVNFRNVVDRVRNVTTVKPGEVQLDRTDPRVTLDPGHPLADDRGMVALSNVNPLIEIADAREAQRSYQTNLSIFDQARRMRSATLDLIRR